ncbi:hypothetical protein AB0I22_20300 [Streptomyces sp. NPDC050610]|uniref:hypothetical protein n=1 Tax=Streptomyces sp. NPDC050610 TaxID=3157097 RepID=UPI003436EA8B
MGSIVDRVWMCAARDASKVTDARNRRAGCRRHQSSGGLIFVWLGAGNPARPAFEGNL